MSFAYEHNYIIKWVRHLCLFIIPFIQTENDWIIYHELKIGPYVNIKSKVNNDYGKVIVFWLSKQYH